MNFIQTDRSYLVMGDCEVYQDGFVMEKPDAIVADPQYGINLAAMCGTYRGRWCDSVDEQLVEGDDKPFDPGHILELGIDKVILWGGVHYCSRLPDARCWLVWDKREGTTPDNQADCEIAWTNLPGPARMHRQLWRGICRRGRENISNGVVREHPTQKPVELMKWCINMCKLDPNSLIYDPYMGSGTTGVAAIEMGHRFIGVEKVEKHFNTAHRRIVEAEKQGRLFV